MTQTENNLTQAYETECCTRCGGGGHYSYCQMYGTVCFKCGGKGKQYTKRGQAAVAYARSLRTVKARDVQAGWLLWDSGGPFSRAGWKTVISAQLGTSAWSNTVNGVTTSGFYYDIVTKDCNHGAFPDSDVQAVPSRERLAEIKAEAMAYQPTLTKAGTPRKGGR
jgi:hypothetical protein